MRPILLLACTTLLLAISWSLQQKMSVRSARNPSAAHQERALPAPVKTSTVEIVSSSRAAAGVAIPRRTVITVESSPESVVTTETMGGAQAWESLPEEPGADVPREQSEADHLRQASVEFANTNLQAAADWAASLPPGETRQQAVLTVGYEAARQDPITALELGAQLAPSESRDELLAHSIRQWATTAGPMARTWVEGIQNLALRQKLLGAIAVVEAEQDAAAAAQKVAELPAGDTQNRTAVLVVQQWAQQDPAAAKAWVEEFPQGPARTGALEMLRQAELSTNTLPK